MPGANTERATTRTADRRDAAQAPGGPDWVPALNDPAIRDYIIEHAGELGLVVAGLIREHQPILGVDLVELVDEKASTVRKAMYRLEEARVAEYEKDTDKSGWETFTWRLTLNEVKYLINHQRKERLAHLKERLDFAAQTEFYQCPNEHPRVDFESAMEIDFKCPHCDTMMANVDNSDHIERLVREIHELEQLVF
jgi:transcription initiation factor TFIIE subunit alpha